MKILYRALGIVVATSLIIVFLTGTVAFIKSAWFKKSTASSEHVAVVDISGVITSAAAFLRDLEEVLDDPNTKAIVVRINSPGGLVGPSQEMFDALLQADKKVPVVVSMGALAASGGYYAALGGRTVFANPGTLTASIGVIMELANTEKLYQWAKVERFTIKAGKFKDAGTPLRAMKPEERELLTTMLLDVHEQFKAAVKERRKLSPQEVEQWTDGRVMTGKQAKEAKLVDALGGFEAAVAEAKRQAKLPASAEILYPSEEGGILRKIIFGREESRFQHVVNWLENQSSVVTPALSPGWRVMLLAPVR